MDNVTANPFTGPVPNWNKINEVIRVVTFASTIAEKAFWNPSSTAVRVALPKDNSSRIRSKIKTFASTAIPIERIRPAIPGNVNVALKAAKPPSTNTA